MERKLVREGPMEETGTVKEAFTRLKADVKDIGNRLVDVSRERAKAGVDTVDRFAHEKPYIATLIGASLGALVGGTLIGWLMRKRRKD